VPAALFFFSFSRYTCSENANFYNQAGRSVHFRLLDFSLARLHQWFPPRLFRYWRLSADVLRKSAGGYALSIAVLWFLSLGKPFGLANELAGGLDTVLGLGRCFTRIGF
jgi:hypothetical protein